jgi:dephospho-CoA kinase
MLRVALTGGVGSGKSSAAAMLRGLGAQVSQSDETGRALMQPGQHVFRAIVEHFGPAVLTPGGELDRGALARVAFGDGRVEELNSIVHPAVIAAQARWLEQVAAADPMAVAVVESALVFETKHAADPADPSPWRTRFDRILVVTAPDDLRRQRYIARITGFNPAADAVAVAEDFARRAAAQWSDERKAALADFVIRNDGNLEALRTQVEHLFGVLRQESEDRAAKAM